MRDINKVLEEIRKILKKDEEYGEIEANIDNIKGALRFHPPEDKWDYVFDKLIKTFILPKTETDYKVLSIWSTKSVEESKGLVNDDIR